MHTLTNCHWELRKHPHVEGRLKLQFEDRRFWAGADTVTRRFLAGAIYQSGGVGTLCTWLYVYTGRISAQIIIIAIVIVSLPPSLPRFLPPSLP